MFQTNIVEKIKIQILHSIALLLLFFSRKRAVYEVMRKNIVEPGRPQMTAWCMSISCCIPKPANTQSEYVILTAFPLQQLLHERASMLCYTYTASLVREPQRCS